MSSPIPGAMTAVHVAIAAILLTVIVGGTVWAFIEIDRQRASNTAAPALSTAPPHEQPASTSELRNEGDGHQ